MNSKITFAIGIIVGAGIGIAGTYSYFKNKYEKLAEEDFNSRRTFDEATDDKQDENIAEKKADTRTADKPSITEYAARLQKEGYVSYSDIQKKGQKQEVNMDKVSTIGSKITIKPYVIQPSEFGEFDDYEKISLTHTADDVLLDDMNEIVDDIEGTVGEDYSEHFGEYEDDSVYVRNDVRKCDYEILLDQRNYQEILATQPHRTEM